MTRWRRALGTIALALLCSGPAQAARIAQGDISNSTYERPWWWRVQATQGERRLLPMDLVRHVLGLVPEAPTLVWAAGNRAPTLLRVGDERPPHALRGLARGVRDIKFLAEGGRIVTVGFDGASAVWDAEGRALYALRDGEAAGILDVQALPCGQRLVGVSSDRHVVVWAAASGAVLRRVPLPPEVGRHRAVRVLGRGRLVTGVTEVAGEPAVLWDFEGNPRPGHRLRQPTTAIKLLEAAPCGGKVATGGGPGDGVYIWDAVDGHLERYVHISMEKSSAIALSRGGATVVVSGQGWVSIWDVATGQLLRQVMVGAGYVPFALIAGERLAAFSLWGAGAIFNARTGDEVLRLGETSGLHCGGTVRVAVSPGGEVMAACGAQGMPHGHHNDIVEWATVWDTATGRVLYATQAHSLRQQTDLFCSVAIGPAVPLTVGLTD